MSRISFSRPKAAVVAALAILALGLASWFLRPRGNYERNAYVDPALCADCHADRAATYRQTGMGRSFHRARAGAEDLVPGKTFHHAPSNSYFAMIQRDGSYVQRRWQIGFDGKETNIDEKRVDYVLGSGNHSRTYLHLTEKNALQELPLAWYAVNGGYWAMNPGYDRPNNPGSVRPIYYECMFCHNGYPRIPEGANKDAAETTYLQPLPEGIDCQRCHGPGGKHVDQASAGAPAESIRAAIVNPARLGAERQMEVCLQCHLETSSQKLPHSTRRFERGPFSYVPGEELGNFQLAFDRAPGANSGFEIAQGAYRFRQSQCFLQSEAKSAGSLSCTTCHDPHNVPRGEAGARRYNQVCQGCHSVASTKLAATGHQADGNCVNCHMPKRRTDDAVHIVMTDHLITRRPPPGDLLAEKPERAETPATSYRGEVMLYYPPRLAVTANNDLLVAAAQVRDESNLAAGLPRLAEQLKKHQAAGPAYYAELAQGYRAAGEPATAVQFFEEALKRDPANPFRLVELGDALMQLPDWPRAETTLRRATQLAPDDPRAWGRLGWTLWQQNKAGEARAALERAVAIDPEIPEPHNNLGLLLWGTGDPAGAENAFRQAIRIQPGVAEWRLNLARALATRGQTAEARFEFEQSLALKPEYTHARVDYARLLSSLNLLAEATRQAQRAVQVDPRSAAAHEILGSIWAARGNIEGARREWQSAIEIQPNFGRAQYELGLLLAQQGDRAGATSHLLVAAQSPDPEIRSAAQQALSSMERR